ncbi:MAG: hypothetical protein KGK30_10390, partial [Elusimicrobia bacterium]|nr:hypothetical protein [Elusimicrobiota bacterium]
GLEYLWMRTFAARLGYQFLQDTLGVTAGFGLRWRDRIQLDYAWAMSSGLADQHRVTLTFLFGAVAPAERARERAPVIERVPEHVPVQSLEDKVPQAEPARPRPAPESRSVPGWIY